MQLAKHWLDEAMDERRVPNPNSISLASVADDGVPSVRIVLCKLFVEDPGYLVFFSNYRSRKGFELTDGARVAAAFHWDYAGRQIRVEGLVQRSPVAESDLYFRSRPWQSQIGAWTSRQSEPVESREALVAAVREKASKLKAPDPFDPDAPLPAEEIPRPPFWGGFRIWPEAIELWCDGEARIHDRIRWTRQLTNSNAGFECGPWSATRLQP